MTKILEKPNEPTENQRLLFAGKYFEIGRSLKDYNI